MKRTVHLFVLVFFLQALNAQVETKFFLNGDAFDQVKLIHDHPKASRIKVLPSFDVRKLIEEDKQNEGLDIPFRFGRGFDTHITLADGEWTEVNGGRLWSMEFQSKGAYSINFVFDPMYLPEGGRLYIANAAGTIFYGPVTSKENTKNGYFLTDLIQGDNVTVYLFEPGVEKGKSQLIIKKVVHAYRNLYPGSMGFGSSGACNNNINCFPLWDNESDGVAMVLLADGTRMCSGSLQITANRSFDPYFLSAFHCIDRTDPRGLLSAAEISAAENWMFKFQYKMTTCEGSTPTTGITYNGATFRAAWLDTDFALMEMDASPLGDDRFCWLGWDRSGTAPTSGTGIHHPKGDVMKISFDNDNLTINNNPLYWLDGMVSPANTHWRTGFDDGTGEDGSSGSPLFDQNERVIGQFHGGVMGCDDAPIIYYGRFNNSWTGGGDDDSRLSNWLNPLGVTVTTTNTLRSPSVSGPVNVCTSGSTTFTLNNVPSGFSISWGYTGNITYITGQGTTSLTVRSNSWGDGHISATLTNGSTSIYLKKNIKGGGISYFDFSFDVYKSDGTYLPSSSQFTYGVLCPNNTYHIYLVSDYCTTSNLQWTVPSQWTVHYTWQQMISISTNSMPGGNVRVNALTSCCGETGQVISAYFGMGSGCYGFMLLSPNPVSDHVKVNILSENEDNAQASYTASITSNLGIRYHTGKYTGKEFTIPTSGLPDGVYIIEVDDGKQKFVQQFMVKH